VCERVAKGERYVSKLGSGFNERGVWTFSLAA
jgi:hypothetical protein